MNDLSEKRKHENDGTGPRPPVLGEESRVKKVIVSL